MNRSRLVALINPASRTQGAVMQFGHATLSPMTFVVSERITADFGRALFSPCYTVPLLALPRDIRTN